MLYCLKKRLNLNTDRECLRKNIKSMAKVAERTFFLNLAANIQSRIPYFDLFIEPLELKNYGLFEVSKAREMFDIGYKAAIKKLDSSR